MNDNLSQSDRNLFAPDDKENQTPAAQYGEKLMQKPTENLLELAEQHEATRNKGKQQQ